MPNYLFEDLDLREEASREIEPPECAESTIVSQSCTNTARCSRPCCD